MAANPFRHNPLRRIGAGKKTALNPDITPVGAPAAQGCSIAEDFALIEDLFTAGAAGRANSGLPNQRGQIDGEFHGGDAQQLRRRHHLVTIELCSPSVGRGGRVLCSAVAALLAGPDAEGVSCAGVYKGRGHFAVIHQAQGAMSERATGGRGNSIRKAAIRLHESVQALVALWHIQVKQLGCQKPDAYAQHLARAQVLVAGCGLVQCRLNLRRRNHLLCLLFKGQGAMLPTEAAGGVQRAGGLYFMMTVFKDEVAAKMTGRSRKKARRLRHRFASHAATATKSTKVL